MKKIKIKKIFHISYAHRLANSYKGECSNIHGHNAKIEIILEAKKLNNADMLIDFNEIKEKAEKWFNTYLDHSVILSEKDIFVPFFKKHKQKIFLVKGNPTAENLSKIIYKNLVQKGLKITKVIFWENETSCASYAQK